MNWFTKFLKLRRQNDNVKMMVVIFILGVVMLGNAVYHGVDVYHRLHTPTEYVLSAAPEKLSQESLNQLEETEGIDDVTIQKQTDLTIPVTKEGINFTCIQISKTYLQEVFHQKASGGMQVFYLSPKAYQSVMENRDGGKATAEEFQARYQMGETQSGVAKFVLLNSDLLRDEEVAFCVGSSIDLAKDRSEVRVHVVKKDVDGTLVRHVENLGYGIENMDVIQEESYELEMDFLKIKYDAGIGILCLGFVVMLGKSFVDSIFDVC